MRIWHKLEHFFFNWDTAVSSWVKYAIIAFVYTVVGYSLYQFATKSLFIDQSFHLELRNWWEWRLSLALFFVGANWYIEMLKWRRLVFWTVSLGRMRALRAVLYGTSLALISPNRVGDFSGRSLFLPVDKRKEGASATIVSSLCQNIPTFLFGAIACLWLYAQHRMPSYGTLLLGGAVAGLAGTLFFVLLIFRTSWIALMCKKVHFSAGERYFTALSLRFSPFTLAMCLGLSMFRYMVFIVQFWLIANTVTDISILQSFLAMAVAYLANAIVPTNQLIELGIRVTLPVFILTHYGVVPEIVALSSFMLWIINLAIPSLVGALMQPHSNEHIQND